MFDIDPTILQYLQKIYDLPLVADVWQDKYLWKKAGEKHPHEALKRVAKAIGQNEQEREVFYEAMAHHLFFPGGRIVAGAGTDKVVTLMNCYVNATLEDSMKGIMQGVSNLALTSQQGGGMGTAFETLRPKDAILTRTQSAASGILPFMDVFNQTGKTIRSAGDRRAAQMGTISDTHPDMPAYVISKGEGLKDGSHRFKEFNLSILISDTFLSAVEDDAEWLLYFPIPPVERSAELEALDFVDEDTGIKQYVYSKHQAQDLWALITQYTYEFSDPGVIFIDRINELNNLSYCEVIRCTNPCGEQPLPPHGTCNLGAINVANIIRKPFTSEATINYELLEQVAALGVRFLDNVIDVTGYPLEEQKQEEFSKRRIGLGITGLGTMFAELRCKYGSQASIQYAQQVMKTIAIAAYKESIRLAKEKGKFPLFDEVITECGFIAARLPEDLKEEINKHGLRNGVILTIAPVGTGSIALGNISSGLEPDFQHEYTRKVRQNNSDNEWKDYQEKTYTKRFYEFVTGDMNIPDFMNTSQDMDILDHLKIQGALQRWVDASVSKTINIPEEMEYDKFLEVYKLAYQYGCKGCTTYRPSNYRMSILSAGKKEDTNVIRARRGDELHGTTYKIKWHSLQSSLFVTINYSDERPYEIFFASKDARYSDWMSGLTLMVSLLLRSDVDPKLIPAELRQVVSTHDGNWAMKNGRSRYYGSLVARIAETIEDDFISHGIIEPREVYTQTTEKPAPGREEKTTNPKGIMCPHCLQPTLRKVMGCEDCSSCGYSKC